MSSHRPSKLPVSAFLVALMFIVPVAFFASLPWLKELPDNLVFLIGGATAFTMVVVSFWLSILWDRKLDEWNRSNAGFSNRWGWTTGASLIALLLAVPPFRDLIVSVVAMWVPNSDPEVVVIVFTFGFMAVVMAQLVCTVLLSVAWALWMSRAPREAA